MDGSDDAGIGVVGAAYPGGGEGADREGLGSRVIGEGSPVLVAAFEPDLVAADLERHELVQIDASDL